MEFINNIFNQNLIEALGWTLIHSIWQGLLLAILMSLLLYGLRKKSSKIKYIFANITLLMMLLLAALTFVELYSKQSNTFANILLIGAEQEGFTIKFFTEASSAQWSLSSFFDKHLNIITTTWVVGLMFFIIKFFGGLQSLTLLRKSKRPMDQKWSDRLLFFAEQLNFKKTIRLGESALNSMPIVIGFLKPIILFPVGMVNSLSANEVDAILAHELSHIVRNDFVFNLLQTVVEAIFYFNPGVWWISAVIRSERENCCDDMAVEMCGDSLAYAKTLVKIEEMYAKTPTLALGFFKDKKLLLSRINRILKQPQNKSKLTEKMIICSLLVVGIFFFSVNKNMAKNLKHQDLSVNNEFNEDHFDKNNREEGLVIKFPKTPKPPIPPKPVKPVQSLANDLLPEIPKLDFFNSTFKGGKFPVRTIPWQKINNQLKGSVDTIPNTENRVSIKINEDSDSELQITLEDGEVKELIVDGKEIDEEDYEDFIDKKELSSGDIYFNKGDFSSEVFDLIEAQKEMIQSQKMESQKMLEKAFEKRDELLKYNSKYSEELMDKIERRIEDSEELHEELFDRINERISEMDMSAFDFEKDRVYFLESTKEELAEAFGQLDEELKSLFDEQDFSKEENHFHYFKQWLIDDLMHRGHLDSEEEYNILIKQNEMTVDGKKLSQKETERYIAEIEEVSRTKWRKGNKLKLKKSKNMTKSSLQLDGAWNLNWEKI